MINIVNFRLKNKLSQRVLAKKAGITYKTLQLIEKGGDLRLSTLNKIAQGLGYSKKILNDSINSLFEISPEAIIFISKQLVNDGEKNWKLFLFNFVDRFRKFPDASLIVYSPDPQLSLKLKALFASTVETLCDEQSLNYPNWCLGIEPLKKPWFVSEMENLKAMALAESPVHFRKRNIFVLGNFLERV